MPRREVLISDLPSRVIAGPVQAAGAPGVWRAVTYSTNDGPGVLLGCGEQTAPQPVTLRLDAAGRYRIWLGLPVLIGGANRVRVRLSGDLCCTPLSAVGDWQEVIGSGGHVAEIHWKDADLTGQSLILEGAYDRYPVRGALAWIRLEPVDALQAAPRRDVRYPLAMTEDGFGIFGTHPHQRPEDILEQYEQVPDGTALKIMLWGAADGESATFPTRTGQVGFGPSEDYDSRGYGLVAENVKRWHEHGWDSLAVPRDYCRQRGWEFHTYIRVGAFAHSYPWDEVFHSRFFYDHPEWHGLDAQGQRVARLSYAYPQVQEHILAIVDEIVAYEPDGVNLCLIRGQPLVLYEPIMVEGFKQQHGMDPRTLGEFDPRWLAYQAEVITPFVRAVKARLKPGMRLSAIVPGNKFDLDRWGLDVAGWVREGLVDDLYPMGQRFTPSDVHVDQPYALHLEYFHTLPGRERIRLIPALYPWQTFRSDYSAWRRLMASFLRRGADGYCVWDGVDQIRKIGDIGLARPADITLPRQPDRFYPLKTVGEFRVDRYHPFEVV